MWSKWLIFDANFFVLYFIHNASETEEILTICQVRPNQSDSKPISYHTNNILMPISDPFILTKIQFDNLNSKCGNNPLTNTRIDSPISLFQTKKCWFVKFLNKIPDFLNKKCIETAHQNTTDAMHTNLIFITFFLFPIFVVNFFVSHRIHWNVWNISH